ncbi:TlpA family protein disulfide reductase [Phytoactinopolyspora halotolerans]|uniref:Thioredoxin family protein n=1 Tax=Phytoactinopolyspora halotolerans TaxID=1981512 RepID=A0A6L9S1T3_9ACTN|nr:thioredoxin family protein [Phytoactinopolyspora halotolerans]
MIGVLVVVVVLVLATGFGLWWKRRDGRVRAMPDAAAEGLMIGWDELGQEPGRRATLVQFSSAFCQPCRATRGVLAHVAGNADGVAHIEVDAESRLDLVRRLGVSRTPTTLIVDAQGRVVGRATGVPRPADVYGVLEAI